MTDENGLLLIESLPTGDYSLVEVKAPEGYQLDSTPESFKIIPQEKLVELTKKNTKKITPPEPITPKPAQPQATPTSITQQPTVRTAPNTASAKQYPKLNMAVDFFLTTVGIGLLSGLWFILKESKK